MANYDDIYGTEPVRRYEYLGHHASFDPAEDGEWMQVADIRKGMACTTAALRMILRQNPEMAASDLLEYFNKYCSNGQFFNHKPSITEELTFSLGEKSE